MTRTCPYYYILDGHEPVPMDDVIAHGEWMMFHEEECRVARTYLGDGVYCVCTSFLGCDHNLEREGEPILFETMIVDVRCGDWWGEQWRYSTWQEAEQGHQHASEYADRKLASSSAPETPRGQTELLGPLSPHVKHTGRTSSSRKVE